MIRISKISMLGGAALLALGVQAPAYAQDRAAEAPSREFDVPAQPLSQAVLAFSQQAGVQLVLESGVAQGVSSSPVKGRLSVAEAVTRLLAGTSLTWRLVNDRTITIEPAPQGAEGERVLGAVRVEGVQSSGSFGVAGQQAGVNGINGSRDITATEGTGSFTSGALTIGSKVPQALKDVPQSISVLTSERLEQQNVTDFNTAMKQLPGVTLVQGGSSLENTFYSRGFAINSIQVDGGAPLITSIADNSAFTYYPQIDMSIYDHVELLRGAAGQFGAYGNPGGTVNLVRKKPLDHGQFTLDAQVGSWSNYRVVADATSPLALDGKLRGRLVMTYQDNRYFYDRAKDNKTLVYGIAELDVTPTTLVTVGLNHTRQQSVPWANGLPRYRTGADLMLPRSTSFVFPWNRWDFDTTEIFGGIEQNIGSDWTAKLNITRNRQSSTQKVGFITTAVNPLNNAGPFLSGSYSDYASDQFSVEATLSGAFTVFGQRQEVVMGVNRADSDGAGAIGYATLIPSNGFAVPYQPYPGGPIYCNDFGFGLCPPGVVPLSGPPINVFAFDPLDALYTDPGAPLPANRTPSNHQVQSGAYINLRLTAFDRLHLTTGLRWSRYEYKFGREYFCLTTTDSCEGKQIGDVYDVYYFSDYGHDDVSWPPPVNISFDVTRDLTAYVGYTDIYVSQASALTFDHTPLDPVTGSNWEGGLKWAARDGKLNLSLAAYRIKQKGFAIFDPDNFVYEDLGNGVTCCYIADPDAINESTGIDLEATGEVTRGWQVSASLTYNENKRTNGLTFGGPDNLPFLTIAPKTLYKLWMSYDFGADGREGALSGLTISGGVNGQSSGYKSGFVCKEDFLVTNVQTGEASCPSKVIDGVSVPGSYEYAFTVAPYAVVSARIDYRFSDNWSLAINLENILDKTYYATTGSTTSGNWYGAPRSFTASVRAKW